MTLTGGTAPITYAWNTTPVQTTQMATGLCAGIYTITVTDANGCSDTETVFINDPDLIIASATSTNTTCAGNNGTATVTASGGTGALTYAWNTTPPQTTATATGLPVGNYAVQITDANGCIQVANATVSDGCGCSLTSSAVSVDASCFASCDGSATVTASGGTGSLTYAWNTTPPQANATAINLCPGTYLVTITDANGCTDVSTAVVSEPAPIVGTTTSTSATCAGNDGTASVSATGGTGAYTYAWSTTPVQTTATATGLAAGTYTVTITDDNGCTTAEAVTVNDGCACSVSANITFQSDPICSGDCSGFAEVTLTGGVAPITYAWSTTPVQTTQTATGLCAGIYTVTVTDAAGCSDTETVIINDPDFIIASATSTSTTCAGNDGTATVTASGGTGALTYAWNTTPPQTTATAVGLPAGNYAVQITDANGCIQVANTTVADGCTCPSVSVAISTNDAFCSGNGASATALPSGATAPITYAWSNSQSTQTISGLSTGTYSVTMTDANGCTASATASVNSTDNTPLLSANITQVSCSGANDGAIDLSTVGGTAPFVYDWNSGFSASEDISGLSAGVYSVVVTDANGCVATIAATIIDPVALTASSSVIDASSASSSDGVATIIPNGGIAPYTYAWSSGQTSQTITGVAPGTYSVTITDANGCSIVETVIVGFAVSAQEIEGLSSISLSPNPTDQVFTLSLEFDQSMDISIQLINTLGQVLDTEIASNQSIQKTYDLDLAAGMYFIRITSGDQSMVKKVMITK